MRDWCGSRPEQTCSCSLNNDHAIIVFIVK